MLLNACLDFVNSELLTPNFAIPICYQASTQQFLYKLTFPATFCSVIIVPVNKRYELVITPRQNIDYCEIQ